MNDATRESALIGWSGFVGSTLLKQANFEHRFRSTDIAAIEGREFDTLVCAGAPAKKWLANKDPEGDAIKIHGLMNHLREVKCRRFILISTVDVFSDPAGVTEDSKPDVNRDNAYGMNRLELEQFVSAEFERSLIVRLPGLVGPGLKKNIIYDLLNQNNLDAVDSRGVFQFYPMVNLWPDIEIASGAGLGLVHLTSAPLSVRDVAQKGFGLEFINETSGPVAKYDFRTIHSSLYKASGPYQYSNAEALLAIRAYAQSELLSEANS